MSVVSNLIHKVAKASSAGRTFTVTHPASNTPVHSVQRSTLADCEQAIRTTNEAFNSWSQTSLEDRRPVFAKVVELLETKSTGWADRLAESNTLETSATAGWAGFQTSSVAGFIRALVDAAPEALSTSTVTTTNTKVAISREPFGVCLAMAAWNAAHFLTARAIMTPLIAGNTVILKTSEHVPATQRLWAEILYEAGLPAGCISVIHMSPEDAPDLVSKLIEDKRVRHVNFTGSTRVGSLLAERCGRHLKPSVMELGGKAPVLLLPDADIATAASHIMFGTFANAGQVCMSTEWVLVPKSRYNELCTALSSTWRAIEAKDKRALFTAEAAKRFNSLVVDAKERGAADLLSAKGEESRPTTQGSFVNQTILGPANPQMALWREESFGPVSIVICVDDDGRSEEDVLEEMITIANDSDYGLTAAVWGADVSRAQRVGRRLETGAVHINSPAHGDIPSVPHGGWKQSGWGRFNGAEGLRSFTQIRTIETPNAKSQPFPQAVFQL